MNRTSPPTDSDEAGDAATTETLGVGRYWWLLAAASGFLPWLSQPPLSCWPFAFVAVVPLLIAASRQVISRKRYAVLYLAATVYWAITLQGLRHANPLIYPCWIALSAYLAIFPVGFVIVLRRLLHGRAKSGKADNGDAKWGGDWTILWAAPLAWVGMECVRNYLLTGISAAMLGHALADVPSLIQIADLGGTYAVSMLLVSANVALLMLGRLGWPALLGDSSAKGARNFAAGPIGVSLALAVGLWSTSYIYGRYRLNQPVQSSETAIALIGRNEAVEYTQERARELELFDAYARESIRAIQSSDQAIDAVVWPESMLTGTIPWTIGEGGDSIKLETGLTIPEQRSMIAEHQRRFEFRAASLLGMLKTDNGPTSETPDLLGGCGVVSYDSVISAYSGIVHVADDGTVKDWYGKTHLVMFGEYVPLIKHVPVIRNWIPQTIGLTTGEGPKRFDVGSLSLCPNICIETAVERVPINHLRQLRSTGEQGMPDAIVTVTNDAWFDDSSVVQHHKRCAQLVAVACRRPVLSAANNGPTMWIDSCGRVIDELPQGGEGSVVARPSIDSRTSLVMQIGDWPARICAFLFLAVLIRRPKHRTTTPE